ncbi:MAG: AcrB/AcrD/AcrF family, partial [Thermoleophilia bacterium]|nr:AcrB/AcrD/AcrF family [Thermoleophilia bacterium]
MRSLVRWCLDRRPVVLLATVLVLLGGIVGATQLRQQLFPDFDFPFAIATLEAPGFDATTLDQQVAQPVERAISAVGDVEGVSTVASDGQLRLYVELAYGSDTESTEDALTKVIEGLDLPDAVGRPEFAGGFQ